MPLSHLTLGARPSGKVLLTAKWIVGNEAGQHRLLENGELVFEAGEIIFVGHHYAGEVDQRIDLGMSLIGPGFIDLDALADLDTTVLAYDNQPAWKKGRVWPESYVQSGPYEMYSEEELIFQKRYAFAQLLLNGITTAAPIASLFYREWGESYAEFSAAACIANELGLRVYLGPAYRSGGMVVNAQGEMFPTFDEERGMQGLAQAVRFIEEHEGQYGGLVRTLLAPDRVETSTAKLLQASDQYAKALGVPLRLHCAQGLMEKDVVQRLHGTTAPRWLQSLGVLSERLLAPHATVATDIDLQHYADNGVSIIHCPIVVARGGMVLRSFRSCRDLGINIAMGTDTAPADMLANMATGAMLCRVVEGRADACSAAELYDAATLGGAKALGRTDIGRLAAQCKADFVVFDLASVRTGPAIDPIQTLLVAGSSESIRAVFVDGRLSMREGAVAHMDWQQVQRQAQEQFDRLVQQYPVRTWGNPPVAEIFPTSYAHISPAQRRQ